jgi:Integrase core domain
LATGADAPIISWLEDHSRFALHVSALARITAPIVVATFIQAATGHGYPFSTLTDNAPCTPPASPAAAADATTSSTSSAAANVAQKDSRPNHPTTCGKVERFQQTMQKWLVAQPVQPARLAERQALIDDFVRAYDQHRPHPSLPHRATPATTYIARPTATPGTSRARDTHDRVPHDKIDKAGCVTLRVNGRLHHIGVGRTPTGTRSPRTRRRHSIRPNRPGDPLGQVQLRPPTVS